MRFNEHRARLAKRAARLVSDMEAAGHRYEAIDVSKLLTRMMQLLDDEHDRLVSLQRHQRTLNRKVKRKVLAIIAKMEKALEEDDG